MNPLLLTLTEHSIPGGVEVFSRAIKKAIPEIQIVGKETLNKNGFDQKGLPYLSEIEHGKNLARYVSSLPTKPPFIIANGMHGWAMEPTKTGIPLISFLHGTYAGLAEAGYSKWDPIYWRMRHVFSHYEKKSAQNGKRVLANSPFTQKDARHFYGVNPHVVELPIDTRVFHPGNKEKARKRCGMGLGEKIVLFVGNPTHSKGFYIIQYLSSRMHETRFHCVCTPFLPNENENTVMHPPQPPEKLADFYRAADVLVFPSRYEGFGFVPLEALASGCPVITSRVGIFHDFNEKGITLIPHNPLNFEKALMEEWERPGKKTLHEIKKRFSIHTFTQKIRENINQLAGDTNA